MEIIEKILNAAQAHNASDIHITTGEKIALRKNGGIVFLNEFDNTSEQIVHAIVEALLANQQITLENRKEIDFSYCSNHGRYRCNVFFHKGNLSLTMRKINSQIPTLDSIGAPKKITELLAQKQGLILITGPAGSGKSTTMAAMIDWINSNKTDHIITLEDPIEYNIENNNCLITQRELHTDTASFSDSLRAALRQDPDIIALGEMRDRETIETALQLCSTGHLVISTIHSANAAQALFRILSTFPCEQQKIILLHIAEALQGILSQKLIPSTNNDRIAVFELLIANHATKNAIRNGDFAQLENTLVCGSKDGMLTFENHIKFLKSTGKVAFDFGI